MAEAEKTIKQLKNHSCICYWTIFNEGWGQFDSTNVYRRVREIDSSRFIDSTSGWFRCGESDVESLHVYFKPVKLRSADNPLVLSEFGGYSLAIEGHISSSKSYGYGTFKDSDGLQTALDSLYTNEIVPAINQGLCATIITQLSDVEDEINGMVTYDRKVVKVDEDGMKKIAEKIRKGEISVVSWERATAEMVADIEETTSVGAYNSMFDYKKAITFTEEYISHLYNEDFHEWEAKQNRAADFIATNNNRANKNEKINPDVFEFRGKTYPLFDIWALSCENLINNDEYRQFCKDTNRTTASGKYYPTNAEVVYRYLTKDTEFIEAHMAVEDADIECEILARVFKKVKPKDMTMGIVYFPFRILGRADI